MKISKHKAITKFKNITHTNNFYQIYGSITIIMYLYSISISSELKMFNIYSVLVILNYDT